MAQLRFQALRQAVQHHAVSNENTDRGIDHFGKHVFSDFLMQQSLPQEGYRHMVEAIRKNTKISRPIADQIAVAMKDWALSVGATHYTHWFQPLTGGSAEKHNAFFEFGEGQRPIERFGGEQLIQQDPDASDFPTGGLRNTFEARGYTAWDPSSPAFVYDGTLCIPTVFVSYTGAALDYKTPLLKSLFVLDKAATNVCHFFDKNVKQVHATLGWEQEFFLVDSVLAQSRPDLVLAGRTLLGHLSAQGRPFDSHYFNSIPDRALSFLREVESIGMKLGIPIKTRHNELAPNQFEIAAIHQEANLAVDHNILVMQIMRRVAVKHNFRVLFHEKPFEGISGSSKHINWSISTNKNVNLLRPGKTPMGNLQFLTFFINTIRAIHQNEEWIRASYANDPNEYRLGQDGAPSTIVSIFIGSQLQNVLSELEKVTSGKLSPKEKTDLKLNVVGKIPEILVDNTDSNRTAPIAFTGNKFEIRSVGAAANCAAAVTVLNTIVADQLNAFRQEVDLLIEKKDMKKDDAIFNVIREYIKEFKPILYDGDGYDTLWEKEAKKRGLSNHKSTLDALKVTVNPRTITLLERNQVLSQTEIEARYTIELEDYGNRIEIESLVLADIARNHVVPTALQYLSVLIDNVKGLKEIYEEEYQKYAREQTKLIEKIALHVEKINEMIDSMATERKKALSIKIVVKKAEAFADEVKPFFEVIRYHCDKLEMMINDDLWPLVKYREILFLK